MGTPGTASSGSRGSRGYTRRRKPPGCSTPLRPGGPGVFRVAPPSGGRADPVRHTVRRDGVEVIRQYADVNISAGPPQPPADVSHEAAVPQAALRNGASASADTAGYAAAGRRRREFEPGPAYSVRPRGYLKSLPRPPPEAVYADPDCVGYQEVGPATDSTSAHKKG
jgi:hypothetical protein